MTTKKQKTRCVNEDCLSSTEMVRGIVDYLQTLSHRQSLEFAEEICYAVALETGDTCSEAQRILTKAMIAIALWHEGIGVQEITIDAIKAEVLN